jgi:hypothetical protein
MKPVRNIYNSFYRNNLLFKKTRRSQTNVKDEARVRYISENQENERVRVEKKNKST